MKRWVDAMKAIVQDAYGSVNVLRYTDIETPSINDDEVLVRVRAASVHPDIWHVMTGQPYVLRLMGAGLRKPKRCVPGTDMAGVVQAVGKNVTRFEPGDEVFGETLSGFQWDNGGTFAEYVAVHQDYLARKPSNLSFEQAATLPTAGLIVLNNLRGRAEIRAGHRVLVNGAAGGVGALAVQVAKALGAHVTGVDAPEKLALVRALGADEVIDYTEADFTQPQHSNALYHLIFDIPGNHSFASCKRVLTDDGVYVLIGHDHFGRAGQSLLGQLPKFFKLMLQSLLSTHVPKPSLEMAPKKQSLELLKQWAESGKITPKVDRAFALEEVAEAMRLLASGQARGRIVVSPLRHAV